MVQRNIINTSTHELNMAIVGLSEELGGDLEMFSDFVQIVNLIHSSCESNLIFRGDTIHDDKTVHQTLKDEKKWNSFIRIGDRFELTNAIIRKGDVNNKLKGKVLAMTLGKDFLGSVVQNEVHVIRIIESVIDMCIRHDIFKPIYRSPEARKLNKGILNTEEFSNFPNSVDDKYFALLGREVKAFTNTFGKIASEPLNPDEA